LLGIDAADMGRIRDRRRMMEQENNVCGLLAIVASTSSVG